MKTQDKLLRAGLAFLLALTVSFAARADATAGLTMKDIDKTEHVMGYINQTKSRYQIPKAVLFNIIRSAKIGMTVSEIEAQRAGSSKKDAVIYANRIKNIFLILAVGYYVERYQIHGATAANKAFTTGFDKTNDYLIKITLSMYRLLIEKEQK